MRLALLVLAFVCASPSSGLAQTRCAPKDALLWSAMASTAINNNTRPDSVNAIKYAKAAYMADSACIKASTSIKEMASYHLAAAHNLAIAARAEDDLGESEAASNFARGALRLWRTIVSTKEYPSDIRVAAAKELKAAEQ